MLKTRPWFRNHYHCAACSVSWTDEWSCMCNDKCPQCNREIEPEESEVLDSVGPEINTEEPSDA